MPLSDEQRRDMSKLLAKLGEVREGFEDLREELRESEDDDDLELGDDLETHASAIEDIEDTLAPAKMPNFIPDSGASIARGFIARIALGDETLTSDEIALGLVRIAEAG